MPGMPDLEVLSGRLLGSVTPKMSRCTGPVGPHLRGDGHPADREKLPRGVLYGGHMEREGGNHGGAALLRPRGPDEPDWTRMRVESRSSTTHLSPFVRRPYCRGF